MATFIRLLIQLRLQLRLRLRLRLLAAPLLLMLPACVRIDGGAVEISWVVRSSEGQAITDCTCAAPPIDRVRLKLNLRRADGTVDSTGPCDGRAQCEFSCQRQTGSTPFDIKETQPGEMYEVSVVALGLDLAELSSVMTPAPILRSVSRGQATEVEAFLLVAQCGCGEPDGGVNRSGVCTRP